MQAEEIPILGLDDVLFRLVAKQRADVDKVRRLCDRVRELLLFTALACSFRGREKVEQRFRPVVTEPDDRLGWCESVHCPVNTEENEQRVKGTSASHVYSRRQKVMI